MTYGGVFAFIGNRRSFLALGYALPALIILCGMFLEVCVYCKVWVP